MTRKTAKGEPDSSAGSAKADETLPSAEHKTASDEAKEKLRKVPNWVKFTVGAVVTALIGIIVPTVYSAVKGKIIQTAPMLFRVDQIVGAGWGVTIPDQQRLQPLLGDINSCNALHAAAIKAGGANDYSSSLSLLLQGNTSNGLTITGMHVRIIKRAAPLAGAYAFCQSAGTETALPINFNLNQPAPAAYASPAYPGAPASSKSKPSFFVNGNVVHLNDGEVFPFEVNATIAPGSSAEWVIEVSVIINGRPSTVTVDDNGRPFVTTAQLPLTQYGDLYEYDWAAEQRLLHFRSHARNPDDCAADVAMKALRSQGLDAPSQVLTVDCAGDLAQVEIWVPSEHCIVHYLGFHRASRWTFFASRAICSGSDSIGALFSRATIAHAGGNPQEFANAFGPYIVSSATIPANPGPYDHVPQKTVEELAAGAGCTSLEQLEKHGVTADARQVATCQSDGVKFLILTFNNPTVRDNFYNNASNSFIPTYEDMNGWQLLVIGPTWLVYGHTSAVYSGYIQGLTYTQFAQRVGGEAGQYALPGIDRVEDNQVPTIANGLL